ncbi:hypothetical protein F8M41_019747 [Gigaspora margarita]|uniref:Uncharacterized protein n=1 Tax=Gigaspora margarita TaxID=4874 RepID=A0A8H4B286_GIGMA|nr:hypothetical protein F8M41_019747 [Gigaspora margarita]
MVLVIQTIGFVTLNLLQPFRKGIKFELANAINRRATDYESWTIMSEVLKNTIPPTYGGIKEKGSPVYYGDEITLINNGTGQKLHSHQA